MKTEDLYLEYARVIKMCEGTNVKPWECVKYEGDTFVWHPNFGNHDRDFNFYKFAIAILEGRPVFVGDNVYHKATGIKRTIESKLLIDDFKEKFTWTKPEPKRTFTLNGVELPCPVNDGEEKVIVICGFKFKNSNDGLKISEAITDILLNARNKQ